MGQSKLTSVDLVDERHCRAVAASLAAGVLAQLPGDRAFVIHLSGALGAGKTTFARGFLEQAGVSGRIRSPTYTLVETYGASGKEFVHVDLYRVSGTDEAEGLGLREYDRGGVVWLIEWPERVAGLASPDVRVCLSHAATGRRLCLLADTSAGAAAMASVEV